MYQLDSQVRPERHEFAGVCIQSRRSSEPNRYFRGFCPDKVARNDNLLPSWVLPFHDGLDVSPRI